MTISANTLALLMSAGVEGDELMAIVRSIEADTAPKAKSKAAERQARYRVRKSESVTSDVTRYVTETSQVTPLACVSDKPITTQKEPVKKTPSRDVADFKAELADLDTDRLEALMKHRKAKKAQMTGHAARLFKRDADECGLSLADATDTCISRNWITVKADWLAKPAARGSPQRELTLADAFAEVSTLSEKRNDPRYHAGDEGFGSVVPYLPRVSGR